MVTPKSKKKAKRTMKQMNVSFSSEQEQAKTTMKEKLTNLVNRYKKHLSDNIRFVLPGSIFKHEKCQKTMDEDIFQVLIDLILEGQFEHPMFKNSPFQLVKSKGFSPPAFGRRDAKEPTEKEILYYTVPSNNEWSAGCHCPELAREIVRGWGLYDTFPSEVWFSSNKTHHRLVIKTEFISLKTFKERIEILQNLGFKISEAFAFPIYSGRRAKFYKITENYRCSMSIRFPTKKVVKYRGSNLIIDPSARKRMSYSFSIDADKLFPYDRAAAYIN